jgi:hypothetical protein
MENQNIGQVYDGFDIPDQLMADVIALQVEKVLDMQVKVVEGISRKDEPCFWLQTPYIVEVDQRLRAFIYGFDIGLNYKR